MIKKSGAIELSIGTIVIVVLAMCMLILGLVLVNKVMCGAINGIDKINDQMQQEMIDLFQTDHKLVIKERENTVYKGLEEGYGIAFAVRNEGEENNDFSYEVSLVDIGNCKFSEAKAEEFIILGRSGKMTILSGDEYFDLIKLKVPKDVEPCQLRYGINVKNAGEDYDFGQFTVIISNKPFTKTIC